MKRNLGFAIICVTGLLLCPADSRAQSVATSFNELRRTLRPGDEILVRHADGRLTRALVREISDSSLDVWSKSVLRFRPLGPSGSYPESSIAEVKRVDGLLNGILIGAGVGVVAAIAACRSDCIEIFAFPAGGMLGGLAGATVDAAIRETVYRAAPKSRTASIAIVPWFTRKEGGASMTLRF
jgi:hypothetical protein